MGRFDITRLEANDVGGWHVREIEFERMDITIIIDALFEYQREQRKIHPRLATRAGAVRKKLLLADIAWGELTAWRTCSPALPPESTQT